MYPDSFFPEIWKALGICGDTTLVPTAPSIGMSRTTFLRICGVARAARRLTGGMTLALGVALSVAIIVNELWTVAGAIALVSAIGGAIWMFGALDSVVSSRFCLLGGGLHCRIHYIVSTFGRKRLDSVDAAGEYNCDQYQER